MALLSRIPWYKRPRAKKLIRTFIAALLGAGVGFSCKFMPEEFQRPCHIAAKLVSLAGGH